MAPHTSRHSAVATPAGPQAVSASIRGHTVLTDQPERAGGSDAAPTPLEMLSVSLSTCIALYVKRHCDELGLQSAGLAVEVKPVWRQDEHRIGRFDVTLHIPDTIEPDAFAAIEEVARTCPVHHTLSSVPDIALHTASLAAA